MGNYKLNRFNLLKRRSCNNSIFPHKIPATTAGRIYKKVISLPFNSSSESKFDSGTSKVGKQPRNIKWEVNFVTYKQNYNPNRCFSKGLGAYCQKISIGGQWTLQELRLHINLLELKAINLVLLTFNKMFSLEVAHFYVDNTTVLSYLMKMGCERQLGVQKFS